MTKFEKNSRPQRKSQEKENIVTAIMITNPKNIERKTKKSRKVIVTQLFPDSKDEDNKIHSFTERKQDEKINYKINFNISTLVVTELLHEMIDAIFKSSSKTLDLVSNPPMKISDDVQSIESGEINSDSECSDDIFETVSECSDDVIELETKEVGHVDDGHTCNQDLFKICPKCIHFKFQGSKKIGPGYNESHKYSFEFNLELSTEVFDLLRMQKIKLKLLCVQNSSSFELLDKSITLNNRILENARVQVSFYSRHRPE